MLTPCDALQQQPRLPAHKRTVRCPQRRLRQHHRFWQLDDDHDVLWLDFDFDFEIIKEQLLLSPLSVLGSFLRMLSI